jgi:hypothetical protein
MLDALTVSAYFLPPPVVFAEGALTNERRSRADSPDPGSVRAVSVADLRTALKKQRNYFEELYHEAERTEAAPEELEDGARIIFDNERKAAIALLPQIEKLKEILAQKHLRTDFTRSVRRSAEESLNIAETWLEVHQNLRIRLLKLASDRRAASGETGSPILFDADEMERYLRRVAEG